MDYRWNCCSLSTLPDNLHLAWLLQRKTYTDIYYKLKTKHVSWVFTTLPPHPLPSPLPQPRPLTRQLAERRPDTDSSLYFGETHRVRHCTVVCIEATCNAITYTSNWDTNARFFPFKLRTSFTRSYIVQGLRQTLVCPSGSVHVNHSPWEI